MIFSHEKSKNNQQSQEILDFQRIPVRKINGKIKQSQRNQWFLKAKLWKIKIFLWLSIVFDFFNTKIFKKLLFSWNCQKKWFKKIKKIKKIKKLRFRILGWGQGRPRKRNFQMKLSAGRPRHRPRPSPDVADGEFQNADFQDFKDFKDFKDFEPFFSDSHKKTTDFKVFWWKQIAKVVTV